MQWSIQVWYPSRVLKTVQSQEGRIMRWFWICILVIRAQGVPKKEALPVPGTYLELLVECHGAHMGVQERNYDSDKFWSFQNHKESSSFKSRQYLPYKRFMWSRQNLKESAIQISHKPLLQRFIKACFCFCFALPHTKNHVFKNDI